MDNFASLEMIKLGLGLLGLMSINIILGSIDSIFNQSFDKVKFKQGIFKSLIIMLCTIGIYVIGYFNPNVIVINVNGQDVGLLTAIYLMIMGGFVLYGKQCIEKLTVLIMGKKTETTVVNNVVNNGK